MAAAEDLKIATLPQAATIVAHGEDHLPLQPKKQARRKKAKDSSVKGGQPLLRCHRYQDTPDFKIHQTSPALRMISGAGTTIDHMFAARMISGTVTKWQVLTFGMT